MTGSPAIGPSSDAVATAGAPAWPFLGRLTGRFSAFPVRRLAGFLGLPVISSLAPLVVLPVLLRYVGTQAWAGIAIGQAVGTGASTLVMLGWPVAGPALVAADPARRRALYTESLVSRLTVFVLAVPVAMLLAAVLAPRSAAVEAAAMALAQSMLGLAATWYFVGIGRPASIAGYDAVPRVAATLLAAVLVIRLSRAWIYPVTLFAVSVALLVVVSVRNWERGSHPAVRTTLRVLRGQWAAAGASVQFAVNTALPLTLVAAVAPGAVVGFAALDRITKFALFSLQPVGLAFQGWVAEPCRSPGARRRTAFVVTSIAGVLLALGFAFTFSLFVHVLFAGEVAVPRLAVLVYAAGIVAVAVNTTLGYHVLVPLGMSGWLSLSIAVNTVLIGGLIALLAPRYGVTGVAVAIVLAELGLTVVQTVAVVTRRARARSLRRRGPATYHAAMAGDPPASPTSGDVQEQLVDDAPGAAEQAPTAPAPAEQAPAAQADGDDGWTGPLVRPRPRRRRGPGVWAWLLLPVLGAALGGAGALAYVDHRAPSYTSEALVSVLPTDPTVPVSTDYTNVWVQIANSPAVVDAAAARLGTTPTRLTGAVTIAQAAGTALISVSVTTPDPARSAVWANGVADELVLQDAPGAAPSVTTGYALRQVTTAVPAQQPAGSRVSLLAGGVAVGAIAGFALAQAWTSHRRRRRRSG